MKCAIEEMKFVDGIKKIKPLFRLRDNHPFSGKLMLCVAGNTLKLRASNSIITAVVTVDLYRPAQGQATFGLPGRALIKISQLLDCYIGFRTDGSSICRIRGGMGGYWLYQKADEYPLGDTFVPVPGNKASLTSRKDLVDGLRICSALQPKKVSIADHFLFKLNKDSMASSYGACLAIFKKGPGTTSLTLPGIAIPTLQQFIRKGIYQTICIRHNPRHIEIRSDYDSLLIRRKSVPIDSDALPEKGPDFTPKLQLSRKPFIVILKRARTVKCRLTIERQGSSLLFLQPGRAQYTGRDLLKMWLPGSEGFSASFNHHPVLPFIRALRNDVITIGTGNYQGDKFLAFDAQEATLYLFDHDHFKNDSTGNP